jgi:hypothetical protein
MYDAAQHRNHQQMKEANCMPGLIPIVDEPVLCSTLLAGSIPFVDDPCTLLHACSNPKRPKYRRGEREGGIDKGGRGKEGQGERNEGRTNTSYMLYWQYGTFQRQA